MFNNHSFNKIILLFFLMFFTTNSILAFKRAKENEPVPELALNDIDGNKIKIADYKGQKIVALVFWKYPSLRGEKALVFFQKLNDLYHEKYPFEIIAVYVPQAVERVTDEEITVIKQIIANNKITFPILIDKGMDVFNRYGVITFPTSAIVNKEGLLVYELPGLPEFFGEKDISKNVKKALDIKEEEKAPVKAMYIAKNNANYFLNLARQVQKKGNTQKAIDHMINAISKDPEFAEAHSYLGSLYTQEKNYTKATESYLQALKLDPANAETLLAYGFLCLEAGMKEDAFLQFRNIIQSNANKAAEGYFGLGSIYLQDGIYDTAIVNQEKAVELYGSWKEFSQDERIHYALAYYNLAETYLKANQKEKATNNFKKSFEIYKDLTTNMLKK
ncbi:tetratricopeptide repeat protein [Candidatus Poribacteria bacterium]|nr:tetratricopeptide repeat protein [Candidatus Poribacteria bacterium]